MKKNILISCIVVALLIVVGYVGYRANKTNEPAPVVLSLPVESVEAQPAVFYMGHAFITPLGTNPVLNKDGATVYSVDGLPVYVDEMAIQPIMEMGGGLPSCYVGNPQIQIDANVRMHKNDDQTPTHYIVAPEHLRSVMIKTEPCKN